MQEILIYGLWAGKQTAKGTPNAAPPKRFRQVGGDIVLGRTDGESNVGDLTKQGQTVDWVDQLAGNGTPAIEATPGELAYLLWLFTGGETTAAVTGPPAKTKHSYKSLPGMGFWHTFFKRLGQTVVQRQQFNDCMVSQLQVEGSTANKAIRVTPTVYSLDPAETKTADPAAAMPATIPFIYTDGTGTFKIDTVAFNGQSQFTLVLNDDLQPVYGDDATIYDLAVGDAVVTIAPTVYMDAATLAQWNTLAYGSAAPAAGTKPRRFVGPLGAYGFYLKARSSATGALSGDEFKLDTNNVKWTVPNSPGPNPAGGPSEIAFAGAARRVGATEPWAIDVNNDDAAYT